MKSKHALQTLILTLCCIAICFKTQAQDSTKTVQATEAVSLNKITLSIIGISYEREQKVGKTTTVYGAAGLTGSLIYQTTWQTSNGFVYSRETETDFKIYPSLNAGFRHYYNFARRVKKDKKTSNNAAGYVGLDLLGIFPPETGTQNQYNIMPQWGFQTRLGRKINFELALGPAIAITTTETVFTSGGKIGFHLLL